MPEFIPHEFLGNSWERWAFAICIFFGIFFACWAVRAFLIARLKTFAPNTHARWDDVVLQLLQKTRFLFLFLLAFHFAIQSLQLHPKIFQASYYSFFLVLFLQVGFWANHALTFVGNDYANRTLSVDAAKATTVRALIVVGQIVVWLTVMILLLDNWGVKVAPFVAGLGIGGIAIALAVQNILGDLFSSLSIVDRKSVV